MRKVIEIENEKYLMDFQSKKFNKVIEIATKPTYGLLLFRCEFEIINLSALNEINEKTVRKWGCVNESYEEVIECIYDSIDIENDNNINVTLSYLLEPFATNFNVNNYYVIGNSFSSNRDPNVICFNFKIDFNGIPIYIFDAFDENEIVKEYITHFYGWQAIGYFNKLHLDKSASVAIGLKDGLLGMVDIWGDLYLDAEYNKIKVSANRYVTVKGDETTTHLHFKGLDYYNSIPTEYSYHNYDSQTNVYYLKKDSLMLAMDDDEDIIVPPIYANLKVFDNFIIATNVDGKKGVIKRENYNQILLDFIYDDIKEPSSLRTTNNLIVTLNNQNGIFSVDEEKILLEPTIDKSIDILPNTFGEGLIGFRIHTIFYFEKKSGFINTKGEIILQFDHHDIFSGFVNGKAKIHNEYGLTEIDKDGKTVNYEAYPDKEKKYTDNYHKDTWDAMTDGQYGDYEGCDDFEKFGF